MIEIIQRRLESYRPSSPIEEEQATKEILQEIALYVLWRAGFFDVAAFQGGTSLRILHQLPRFSEDLDFILKAPDGSFEWNTYLRQLETGMAEFGLQSQILDKSNMDQPIRQAVLKDDSISNQLNLKFYRARAHPALKIKLEIDVNPPAGSGFAYSYLDFPLDFSVCHQDLSSNFALKIHALPCRPYVKGANPSEPSASQGCALSVRAVEGPRIDLDVAWVRRQSTRHRTASSGVFADRSPE